MHTDAITLRSDDDAWTSAARILRAVYAALTHCNRERESRLEVQLVEWTVKQAPGAQKRKLRKELDAAQQRLESARRETPAIRKQLVTWERQAYSFIKSRGQGTGGLFNSLPPRTTGRASIDRPDAVRSVLRYAKIWTQPTSTIDRETLPDLAATMRDMVELYFHRTVNVQKFSVAIEEMISMDKKPSAEAIVRAALEASGLDNHTAHNWLNLRI
jgi:hypothetical protein